MEPYINNEQGRSCNASQEGGGWDLWAFTIVGDERKFDYRGNLSTREQAVDWCDGVDILEQAIRANRGR